MSGKAQVDEAMAEVLKKYTPGGRERSARRCTSSKSPLSLQTKAKISKKNGKPTKSKGGKKKLKTIVYRDDDDMPESDSSLEDSDPDNDWNAENEVKGNACIMDEEESIYAEIKMPKRKENKIPKQKRSKVSVSVFLCKIRF